MEEKVRTVLDELPFGRRSCDSVCRLIAMIAVRVRVLWPVCDAVSIPAIGLRVPAARPSARLLQLGIAAD